MKKIGLATVLLFSLTTNQGAAQDDREESQDRKTINQELLELVRELKAEVAALRQEVNELKSSAPSNRAVRDREWSREGGRREGDRGTVVRPAVRETESRIRVAEVRPERDRRGDRPSPEVAKLKKVFEAYDRNNDQKVHFQEWLAMKEGKMTDERAAKEKKYFVAADADGNETISLDEFVASRTRKAVGREDGSEKSAEERRDRKREGDRERSGDRKREGDRD